MNQQLWTEKWMLFVLNLGRVLMGTFSALDLVSNSIKFSIFGPTKLKIWFFQFYRVKLKILDFLGNEVLRTFHFLPWMTRGCECIWVIVVRYFFKRSRESWRKSWSWQLKTLFALTHLFWIGECQMHESLPITWIASCWLSDLELSSKVCTLSHSFSFKWIIIELCEVNC